MQGQQPNLIQRVIMRPGPRGCKEGYGVRYPRHTFDLSQVLLAGLHAKGASLYRALTVPAVVHLLADAQVPLAGGQSETWLLNHDWGRHGCELVVVEALRGAVWGSHEGRGGRARDEDVGGGGGG